MTTIDHLLECTGWFKTPASTSEDRSYFKRESISRDFKGTVNLKELTLLTRPKEWFRAAEIDGCDAHH